MLVPMIGNVSFRCIAAHCVPWLELQIMAGRVRSPKTASEQMACKAVGQLSVLNSHWRKQINRLFLADLCLMKSNKRGIQDEGGSRQINVYVN